MSLQHNDLQASELSRAELFERLAAGHAVRITVLTPNRRLAQTLQAEFGAAQAQRGLAAWETADILPFGAFVERCWDDALHSGAAELPQLASPLQEQALWEEAIAGAQLLSASAAAAQCQDAWRLLHGWRLQARFAAQAGSEDAKAFADWARRYERRAREQHLTDAARLPDLVTPLLGTEAVRVPKVIVLYEFDLLAPQQRAFVAALASAGAAIFASRALRRQAEVRRVELAAPADEWLAAARWARSRLAIDPGARIGIVVPDLAQQRARVERTLSAVLHPAHLVEDAPGPLAFNLSAGQPLDQHPLVADALALLALCGRECSFEEASRLLRSPFIAGAEAERGARARFDAELRCRANARITLEALLAAARRPRMPRAPHLADRLERLAAYRKAQLFGARPAGDWARAFAEALRTAGFPGERSLDTVEFQALEKWHEALAAFASLERVTARMGFAEAFNRLARLAREAVFQPESHDAPIQVLGILESAGLAFDHLWVAGLTDEAWPLAPRPNPFVPLRLQREAGIPNADAGASLELDRRLTEGWLGAAHEVVVSHARMKGDAELAASPLVAMVAACAVDALDIEDYATLRQVLRGAATLERIEDGRGPALDAREVHGGTSIFRDQAACPFRAFAHHRLRSRPLEQPQAGLSEKDRGILVHEVMNLAWESLAARDRLVAADPAALQALLEACAEEAVARMRRDRREALPERFARVERRRLVALARAWLALESSRTAFTVVEREVKRPMTFAGVTVNARLDRMDRLAQGGHAILDYKTGAASLASWLGPRPDEPQLPMYALACGEDVRALAFARVKAGEMEFCGVAMEDGLLPGVKTIQHSASRAAKGYRSWPELVAGWRREIEALANEFATGEARATPKGAQTCRQCDQQSFCRIAEKEEAGDDR